MGIFGRAKKYSDQEIIDILRSTTEDSRDALEYLYRTNYKTIERHILSRGGSATQAEDIFQDAIIAFYEQVQAGKFRMDSRISTYLFSIAKNKWINQFKKNNRQVLSGDFDRLDTLEESSSDSSLLKEEIISFSLKLLKQLGDDCQKVLHLYIYKRASMEKIAQIMGFSSDQVARNKKYRCLERLKKLVQASPELTQVAQELRGSE